LTPPTPPIRSTGFPHNFPTEGRRMAEKVEKLSVHREKDFMYYVKDAAVWKVQRKQPGVEKGKPEKVAEGTFEMDTDFIYFVDRDGDVSRAKRAVGGQKRKKTIAPVKLITGRGAASKPAKPARTKVSGSAPKRAGKTPVRAGRGAAKAAAKGKVGRGAGKSGKTSQSNQGKGNKGKAAARASSRTKSKAGSSAKPAKGKAAAKRKSGR